MTTGDQSGRSPREIAILHADSAVPVVTMDIHITINVVDPILVAPPWPARPAAP